MKTNKLDNSIKEKFAHRTFDPSVSAWERLSVKLDEQPKQKKKGWFFYIGAAASILLLVSIGIQLFKTDEDLLIPKNEVVEEQINLNVIDEKINQFLNEVPVKEKEVIVNTDKVEEKPILEKKINKNVIANKTESVLPKQEESQSFKTSIIPDNNKAIIAKIDATTNLIEAQESVSKENFLKQDPNSTIKINSDDLLFAVTHSPQEVKNYYAKHNISRDVILETIQNQLKESNLKINPETILAEVERTIVNDDFQNNFMKSIKRRITDIATAIASRNN